jgi:hypothetical protein
MSNHHASGTYMTAECPWLGRVDHHNVDAPHSIYVVVHIRSFSNTRFVISDSRAYCLTAARAFFAVNFSLAALVAAGVGAIDGGGVAMVRPGHGAELVGKLFNLAVHRMIDLCTVVFGHSK